MAKLVAIGDSLTQGFQSLAISQTDLSFPALIAERMGLPLEGFRTPDFSGSGGLPLNLEWLAREVERRHGRDVSLLEWLAAGVEISQLVDQVEDYWETGRGAAPVADTLYHNLAVWGFEAADAYNIDAQLAETAVGRQLKDDWFQPPSQPRMRTALRVLNPARLPGRRTDTQLSVARKIRERDGEIEHLIVWLGANNALLTVVELDVRRTGDEPPGPLRRFTLWRPRAFAAEYAALVEGVKELGARNVYVATVPHVTIAPLAHGEMEHGGELPEGEAYFDRYRYVFAPKGRFDPRERHLTREEAIEIDACIDAYNQVIRGHAADNGWAVVDACKMLDDLAYRRNHGRPRFPLPAPIADLDVRFFQLDRDGKRLQGGLFSLDGVHPTTCGYGLIAQAFIDQMRGRGASVRDIDFADLRRWDSLVTRPPQTVEDIEGMLRVLERRLHLTRLLTTLPRD